MEQAWVALLRGINLGSRNRVLMAELRRVFEDAGCSSVSTYIQSGNVLFTSRASDRTRLAPRLERAVDDAFGVSAAVVLRTFEELGEVAQSHPFGADTSKTHVVFLAGKPDAGQVRALADLDVAPDEVEVVGSDVFLRFPNGIQGARLTGALLERTIGVAGTMRNWRTVTKLAELAAAAQQR
ncbi:MAG TPA: DUF1697 domain-containing protein [Gaiellaceae bacterium]|jgi:uncharacterized protein (DUF1697 family)